MDQKTILLTILGMMLVTYFPRVLPVWILSSRSLPPLFLTWLRYIPVSVMAAMVLPSLIVQGQGLDVSLDNVFLVAAVPTILVAWKTRSLFTPVLLGMMVVAFLRFIATI
jgi:branched-subunit amino acid transport protein